MRRSGVLLGILALIPAVPLVTSYSSLGAAQGDECRIKPDGSAPPGLHWYYRVDRASNRHCWYLHTQGMPVHAVANAPSRRDVQNDAAGEQVPQAPPAIGTPQPELVIGTPQPEPVIGTPQPNYEPSETMPDRAGDFTSRWVDLPKSVDLNTHELAAGTSYAAEQGAADSEEQLPATWPNVSVAPGEARQNSPSGTSLGSISLAGAAALALFLISEALLRFLRRSGRNLVLRRPRASHPGYEDADSAVAPSRHSASRSMAAPLEPRSPTPTGAGELRHLLQRADTGLRPPKSFAPPPSMQPADHGGRARAHSALQRLKSRSFSGMTWAPL